MSVGGGVLGRPVPALDDTRKACLSGTHRVLTAAETLRRIEPLFPVVGITRLADVTWLDEIGIPVYQAVRPNSWTVSVSQGKGLTDDLAKVSAAMESIESWHAERVGPGAMVATVADMERECGYRVHELSLERRHHLWPGLELEWTRAIRLDGGADTFLPTEALRLDGRVRDAWMPPLFALNSNGLASGNTFVEAALHGLYEVIERDCLVRAEKATPPVLDLTSVDGPARDLLDRMDAAAVDVRVEVMPSPTGLACFLATIWSEEVPVLFAGVGVHLDRDVALCRALTEAAQSRVTQIAGTRDDLTSGSYRRAASDRSTRLAPPSRTDRLTYDEIGSVRNESLTDDLHTTVARVVALTGRSPLVVDHTRPDVGIPVVRVVSPGLDCEPAFM
ncbi:YcaO-like family protein [Actinoallomurus purpureus]|uniref:YcaO-like family protein n=1 Tax=Actinoallomurus purpureus TaxID=478114 RepID=UPI002092C0E0|nr:YcaO-like family protein [Actinoallomurus purpureus]MCO6009941.1 YcaO-like family protein [Actinoallomurus purpureus]